MGPGLLARLAAAKGFAARGIDRDAEMIAAAELLAKARGVDVAFATSDIDAELASGRRYAIVSASSLIVVTSNPTATLAKLLSLLARGGRLLVIEASHEMSRARAVRMLLGGRLGKRGYMLLPWAMARSGRALPDFVFQQPSNAATCHPMLGGLVNAWVIEARA